MNADDADRPVQQFTAHEMGWMRRVDIGPNAWEWPNGAIYLHTNAMVPVATRAVRSLSLGPPHAFDDRSGD